MKRGVSDAAIDCRSPIVIIHLRPLGQQRDTHLGIRASVVTIHTIEGDLVEATVINFCPSADDTSDIPFATICRIYASRKVTGEGSISVVVELDCTIDLSYLIGDSSLTETRYPHLLEVKLSRKGRIIWVDLGERFTILDKRQ